MRALFARLTRTSVHPRIELFDTDHPGVVCVHIVEQSPDESVWTAEAHSCKGRDKCSLVENDGVIRGQTRIQVRYPCRRAVQVLF